MSFGVVGRLLKCLGISAAVWLAVPAVSDAQVLATFGSNVTGCSTCCQSHHCPPAFRHCQEGPPRLHFGHGCPHPICNPCDLPRFGYFETCWSPFPWGPDWSHCATPPPAAFVGIGNQNLGVALPYQPMPSPGTPQRSPGTAPTAPIGPGGNLPEELPRPMSVPRTPGLQ